MDEKINVRDIFETAKRDPELFSTLDIENILTSIENEKNDYLENKTMDDITNDIYSKIAELPGERENKELLCEKLIGYRYVDEIHELFKGRHVRWIRLNKPDPQLTTGGILVNVKFTNDGMQLMCKNNMNRFIQYKFDECLTFQKLSTEEQLLLIAYENLAK
jgi:hypothetical protein